MTEPLSWAWKPLKKFSIDVELCGQHIVAELDAADREQVAEGLARLADAVMGQPRRLLWRWEDGALWDLDNGPIELPDSGRSSDG